MNRNEAPPRIAEWLVAATAIDAVWRDSILGDLHEEYAARSRNSGGLWRTVWYWTEALRLATRFGFERLLRRARTNGVRPPTHDQESSMATLKSDLKLALRNVAKQPGYSLVVAVTLALGLGLNATIFGMIDAMLLRPFQFRDYERIAVAWGTLRGAPGFEAVAPANYLDWRNQTKSFEQLVAWEGWHATLTGHQEPERVQAFRVSPGFMESLSIVPVIGRTFTPDEEQIGNHRRVILSDGLWKRRFGGDRGIVGTDVLVSGEPYTVVGIAPPRFTFPVGSDMWAPLAFAPPRIAEREERTLTVAGKLKPGHSLAAAQSEMNLIARRLEQQYPEANRERGVALRPLSVAFRESGTSAVVGTLQAGAALVLLVACANVAGLLLARGVDRQRELAVRVALGASRGRIIRQLVTETVVLGIFASAGAVLLATAGLDVLRSSMPAETARFVEGWDNLRLDTRFAFLIPVLAIGVGLVVGLIPAIASSRGELTEALKQGDRGGTGGLKRQRGRQALVVAQIAFALALLSTAGLTIAGGVRLVNQPGGFDSRNLLRMEISLPDNKYREPAFRREFAAELLAKVKAIPMVDGAALANVLPASGWSPSVSFAIKDQPVVDAARRLSTGYRSVSAGYFETMRIPLVRGRTFSSSDREGSQPVAIISASMAQRFWPGQDPSGRLLRLDESGDEWVTVVGVVGDVKMYNWWDGGNSDAVYMPLGQAPPAFVQVALRTRGEPGRATASVREAVRSIDPLLPVDGVRTMREAIAGSSLGLTHMAVLMGICGAIALVLSAIGIYSVMVYTVAQRTREFGVRIALGATAQDVLRLALRQAGIVTAVGLSTGVVIALLLGQLVASSLFGVVSLDVMLVVWVSVALGAVSMGAAYLPARRALRLDPAAVLRSQ